MAHNFEAFTPTGTYSTSLERPNLYPSKRLLSFFGMELYAHLKRMANTESAEAALA